jgi:YHYH protein
MSTGAVMAAACVGNALAHDPPGGPIPVGDGQISASARVGYVFACQTRFRDGPGMQRLGDWVTDGMWDQARKPFVAGDVSWPAGVTIALEGDRRIIRGNGLPKHQTGSFPIARSDEAFQYDPNPNNIRPHDVLLTLPAIPTLASGPSCVPMGPIGFALSGAYIYNALDAQGRDAPVHEMQDRCNGHPEFNGRYHYHNWSPCIADASADAGRHSDLAGFALDGFGLFGPRGEAGKIMTNADLDECHGHTHEIEWNGSRISLYHYHFTREYPYTIGCYRGTAARVPPPGPPRGAGMGAGAATKGKGDPAPLEAAARELGIAPADLRRALGPPPPDFAKASVELGIPEARLRETMRRARGRQD